MNQTCLGVYHLSKRFLVLKSQKSLLRVLRAWASGGSLRREHWVLRDVTFEIEKGEKVALVGKNGSGKTTLLRILAGIFQQTSGALAVDQSPAALFSCSIGFLRDLPVVDNIYLFGAVHGIDRSTMAQKQEAILEMAEVDHLAYSPLKELSLGQVQRLALSIFSQAPNEFLIFDEVLANVDHGFMRKSESYFESLARSGRTLILTSHDSSFLRRYCERAIWLDGGRLRRSGPFEVVIDEYERS